MIIVLSPESPHDNEPEWVTQMFKIGLDRYHLRYPDLDPRERQRALLRFPKSLHGRISIHGDINFFGRAKFGRHKKGREDFECLEPFAIRSASFHTPKEVLECPVDLEYGFISPVFSSISKQGYKPKLDEAQLKELLSNHRKTKSWPLLPLGGICQQHLQTLKNMDFKGIVLKGVLWQSSNPVETFSQISEQWKTLQS